MNRVNRILFRRSGTLNALTKALSTIGLSYPGLADQLGPASGLLDLGLRRLGEGMGAHGERLVDLASREDLDRRALMHDAVRVHRLGIDLATLEDRGEQLDVHDGILDAVRVREALQLRDAPRERHLPTFETERNVLAGARALRAPAGGLAAGARTAAADPLAVLRRALGGLQVRELHPSTSSTVT